MSIGSVISPDADRRPVDRADDRLGGAEHPQGDQPAAVAVALGAARERLAARARQVGAGRRSATAARDDDRPHLRVGVGAVVCRRSARGPSSQVNALSASGRSRVIVATCPSTS
jgi:hypothetical protein